MSSLLRKMQRESGNIGTRKPGKYVGLRNPDCKCCAAFQLRNEKKAAKKGGHVL